MEPEVTDICEGRFDAIGVLDSNILVFKGRYVWRMDFNFEVEEGFPMHIRRVFPNLPRRFRKIDAIYRAQENEVVMFCGSEYITYDNRGPIYNSYNITRYTDDEDIEKIDAAMIWGSFF